MLTGESRVWWGSATQGFCICVLLWTLANLLTAVYRCCVPPLCTAAVYCCVPQAWPDNDLLVQYKVWRDNITAVVQVEPPAPESGETLGTFVLSVMPPGPEESVCFRRDVIFVFDRSGSMTGAAYLGLRGAGHLGSSAGDGGEGVWGAGVSSCVGALTAT